MSLKTKASRFLETPIVSISRIMVIVAMVVVAVMMLLTVSDVFLRYAFKNPIPDSQELTEYLMVCVAFLGMAWVAIKGEHITVNLVISRLSPRAQAIFDSVTYFLGLGVVVLISWRNFLEAPIVRQIGLESLLLRIPEYPFYLVLAVGLAILCLAMLIQLIQHVSKAVKG